jgi:hypothetical protein
MVHSQPSRRPSSPYRPWPPHTDARLATRLAFACLLLGCKGEVVANSGGSPDAAVSERTDGGVDAPNPLSLQLDTRSGDAQEDSGCTRSVTLRGVTIARPVPFDVVIVADNSDSLSWSRDSLSSGLANLLSRVHGHEARFFVLTTTQYGASSQDAVSPLTGKDLVSWRDAVSGAAYLNEVTRYRQTCTDRGGAAIACPKPPNRYTESWKVKGTWQFQMPPAVAAITADMDDGQIAEQQRRIADAVLALGGGGSPQEQPICTLLRYIGQSAEALPKHAVFVALTDEDDTSPPDLCLAGYDAYQEAGVGTSKVVCDSDCPEYVYVIYRPNQEVHLDFSCVPVDDKGTAHPERASQKSLLAEAIALCAGDAGTTTTGACTDGDLAKAGVECGAGALVQDCKRSCVVGNSILQCNLSRPDNKTDLCTQPFDQGGVHYANLAEYCAKLNGPGWNDCKVMGLKPAPGDAGAGVSYSEFKTPLVPATSTADMIQAFGSSADRLIGRGNYSVEAIVLDPAFDCPLNPGQSYATNLRSLASSASDVFPLCEDYAPAIERIASFAEYLVQTTFPLDLDEYEEIDSVVVTDKQGVQRTVPPSSYAYDRAAKVLRFGSGVLTAQDESLAVNVARYCHTVIP